MGRAANGVAAGGIGHLARRFSEAKPWPVRRIAGRRLQLRRPAGSFAVRCGRRSPSLPLWLLFTTMHSISGQERGVVTRFGRYSHTLSPGIGLTLPSPIDRVQKINVEDIREVNLGSAAEETLMLTGDQNLIDIAYQVRWNIRDPEQYLYELAQPEDTIRQVAESAMRQIISQVSLQDAMGVARGDIEAASAGRDAADARWLSLGRRDPGRGDPPGRSARRGQRCLQGSHRRPAEGAEPRSTTPTPMRCSFARSRRARRRPSTRSTSSTGWRLK